MGFPTKVSCLVCGATGPFPCPDTRNDERAFEVHGRYGAHGMFQCRECGAFNLMKFRLILRSSFVDAIRSGDPRYDGIVRTHAKLLREQTAEDSIARDAVASRQRAEAYYGEGAERGSQGDDRGAIAAYSAAVEADPTFSLAYLNRAVAYIRLGKGKQALKDLETCHATQSADWDRAYSEAGAEFETKEDFINASEGLILSSMGQALYKCRKYQAAIDKTESLADSGD